ncbi:hypothetical protein LY78DRAFT_682008 [Colletotrichum sublineola]|nr:hypothetical protein LY78DRAFT_682008 [Colletotrichum sublineola]
MDHWSAEFEDFIRLCSDSCPSAAVSDRFFGLESRITANGQVDPLDLRATLPRPVAQYIISGCDSDSLRYPKDPQCIPKLEKACNTWNIDSSLCLFLLCISRQGRPFFDCLKTLAQLCQD